ncbi:MAG: carbohydrate kinase [Bacteroidales bacterium]|nr:carbohydrate kinase [Bacteroidales bacterium]
MKKAAIFCLGETVFDIVFDKGNAVSALPGGSCLNTAVSLGRLKLPVHLVSEVSDDFLGRRVQDFLAENRVSTDYLRMYDSGKTALALAFIDEKRDASYTFYKMYPSERQLIVPAFSEGVDYFHFGSFFSLAPDSRKLTLICIREALKKNCLVMYDPNFRKAHLDDLNRSLPFIEENIYFSDIVRGSDEDFRLIFGAASAEDVFRKMSREGNKVLIYTRGSGQVTLLSNRLNINMDVPGIQAVNTIGAGDSFNAGILYKLYLKNIHRAELAQTNEKTWRSILETAAAFGSHVCLGWENYIPESFALKMISGF